MADPENDHGLVFSSDDRIDFDSSPFFDIGFGDDQFADEYINMITPVIVAEIEIRLGINLQYQRRHPGHRSTGHTEFSSLDTQYLLIQRFLPLFSLLRDIQFLRDVPLYLEWAPDDILRPSPGIKENELKDAAGEQNLKSVMLEQAVGVLEEEIDPDRVESRSVFVKNLNFMTSDESLKEHFGKIMKCGSIKSAKVKKHLKNGKNLSMGFGFIEFDSVETATNICRDLQGSILDGHALNLQLCHAKIDAQALKKEGKDMSSTKLIVRNVAFEATEKDLRQLFSPFGQIKSLRLPMKLGRHRGFAFVEYVTKQETQNAFQALSSTHLYGRHLVLERAKEGESLEELRARTAAQFVDEHSGFQRLSKKRKSLNILDEGNVKFTKILD